MASHILAGELPAPHANEPVMSRLIPRVRSGILRANRTDVNATHLGRGSPPPARLGNGKQTKVCYHGVVIEESASTHQLRHVRRRSLLPTNH